jgi:hypothetical protein
MAGPYLQVALEEAPNYQGSTNKVSTDVFYPFVKTVGEDRGQENFEENDVIPSTLDPLPHKGASLFAPTTKLGEVHPRPADLGLWLALAMGSVVTTAGVGGATVKDPANVNIPVGAHRHVFAFKDTEPPLTAQTYSRSGDGFYAKGQGLAVEEFAVKFVNGMLTADISFVDLVLAPVSDPSISPVVSDEAPFRRGDLALTWLSNSAHTTDFDFSIKHDVEAINELMVASDYPSLVQFKNDAARFIGGTISKSSMNDVDMAALEDGTQFAATITVTGREAITTGYYPKLWIELPGCQLIKANADDIAAQRRREGSWEWEARYDAVTAKLCTVTLVNAQAAYDTYPA